MTGRLKIALGPVKTVRRNSVSSAYQRGNTHEKAQRYQQAIACYDEVLALDPNHAKACNAQGRTWVMLGRYQEAANSFQRAYQIQPDYAVAYCNHGVTQQALRRYKEALVSYNQALALNPREVKASNNKGDVLLSLNRHDEAIECFTRALVLNPGYAPIHNNLGRALQQTHRYGEALASYDRALEIDSRFALAVNNRGAVLCWLGRYAEAVDCYRRALELEADYPGARFNLACGLLRQGDFEEGWQAYEARFDSRRENHSIPPPEIAAPRWSGEPLQGKNLLVWYEQGFGDEIQFVRYLPLLKRWGVKCLSLVCKDPLKHLFTGIQGADRVIAKQHWRADMAHSVDYWCFIMSLPLYFGTRLDTIPAQLPYLYAPAGHSQRWASELAAYSPPGHLRVGLVWAGNPKHSNDNNRSLASPGQLKPLWAVPKVRFFSIQKKAGRSGVLLSSKNTITQLDDQIADFADTAAIISHLDLVISVDTAIAHLAGALGVNCWVLLPFAAVDWRWLLERKDSPWYPGVMRLFRQAEGQDWSVVIDEVAQALQEFSENKAKPATPPFCTR